MTSPLISIITPNYNCEKFISQTIESVFSQTYPNWELLIQDDCSTDKSYEIALEYASKDSRIKVERNDKNAGAAVTRNNAIERSQGEYLAFLDSDDLWFPEKLEKQLAFMQENDCDFSFTKYQLIKENGEKNCKVAKIIKKLTYKKYLLHCWTGCLTVMYRQNIMNKVYSYNIKSNNDYGLFLQVIKNCKNAMGIDEITAFYRIRGNSLSHNKLKKVRPYFELMQKYENKNFFQALLFLTTDIIIKWCWKYKKVIAPPHTYVYILSAKRSIICKKSALLQNRRAA